MGAPRKDWHAARHARHLRRDHPRAHRRSRRACGLHGGDRAEAGSARRGGQRAPARAGAVEVDAPARGTRRHRPGDADGSAARTAGPSLPLVAERFQRSAVTAPRAFETSDLRDAHSTFTFRRFVLTGDATIAERLRSVVEIEFERLNELEVERRQPVEAACGGSRTRSRAVTALRHLLEQSVDAVLPHGLGQVPGRACRSSPSVASTSTTTTIAGTCRVAPSSIGACPCCPRKRRGRRSGWGSPATSPWETRVGSSDEAYVMNGVTFDATIETVARPTGELEAEVEIRWRGTANIDFKERQGRRLRVAGSPTLGTELAVSGYAGRYTPDFLPAETLWAPGSRRQGRPRRRLRGRGRYLRTRYEGIRRVAQGLALRLVEQKPRDGHGAARGHDRFRARRAREHEAGLLADLRYRFFPDALRGSLLGRRFENPQFVVTTRIEQVWLDGAREGHQLPAAARPPGPRARAAS